MYRRFSQILLIITLVILASIALAEQDSGPATIEVMGEARIMAQPNLATISFAVETSAAKARQAVNQNAAATDRLLNVLRKTSSDEAKIKTSGFSLSPVYGKDRRLRPEGYRVRNTVILETKSLDKLGTFIDEAAIAGVSHIGSLEFSTDQAEQLRQKAAVEAVRQAMETADNLAKAAGLTIKKIIKIIHAPSGPMPRYRMEAMAAVARTPIEVGEIAIEERVKVVFEVK